MGQNLEQQTPKTAVEKLAEECKRIYKLEHGKDLTHEEAMEMATHLLSLYRRLYRPRDQSHQCEEVDSETRVH